MGERRCVDFGDLAQREWWSLKDPFDFARKCEQLCERCRGAVGGAAENRTGSETVDGWTVIYECTGPYERHEYKCVLLVTRIGLQ